MRFPRRHAQLQPLDTPWCGPAALRHALLCYGEERSQADLAKLCATGEHGTYQKDLERGARRCGYRMRWAVRYHPDEATNAIIETVNAQPDGHPVLLCVDRAPDGPWQHWIAVVGAHPNYVTIADSSNPGPVVQRRAWGTLMRRLAVLHVDGRNRFDLYPLVEAA